MLYNIYYNVLNEKCFGWPAGLPLKDRECEFLAIYETETDSLELHDTHFNWYGTRNDWEEELNRAVQEIIDSPVVWYCLIHGDCHITDRYVSPINPCNTERGCICEMIATVHGDHIVPYVKDLERYFDDANDGYTFHHLESELASYNLENMLI
tara:strand:+ start:695 stop:1153 length:459 start_codon:yes stop_codon:yes gene_type:complete